MMTSSRGLSQLFSRASKTRLSCSHVHEKNTHPRKQVFEKKETIQFDAENMENSGDKTDRATMRSTTHTPQLCLHADQQGDKTVEFFPEEPRIPENTVGTQNTNSCKTRISSTPAEHDCGLFIQFVTKTSTSPWPSEKVETQKLSHTEGEKTSTLTKCLDRADAITKHGSFHTARCAVTAGVLKKLLCTRLWQIVQNVMSLLCLLLG